MNAQEQIDKYFQAPIHEQKRFRLIVSKKSIALIYKSDVSAINTLLAKVGLGKASLKQVAKVAAFLKVGHIDFYRLLLSYNETQPFYKRIPEPYIQEMRLLLFDRLLKKEPDEKKRTELRQCLTFEELLASSIMQHSYPVVKQLLELNVRQDIVTEPGELKALLRIETLDENGHTGLMRAALLGDTTQVQMFLDLGALINRKGGAKKTALLLACEQEDPEVVRLLLQNGADGNVWDEDGNTPLHLATLYSSKETVELLLQNGAAWQVEIRNAKFLTALDPLLNRIKKSRAKEAVELAFNILWAHHLQSEKPFKQILQTAIADQQLRELFEERHEEMLLLEAIKNHPSEALFKSALEGNQDPKPLRNLLAFCINAKFSYLVIQLLKRGATLEGQTAFQMACTQGDMLLIEKLLRYAPHEVRTKNAFGQTPLHLACRHGQLDLAKLLLSMRADIDVKDSSGKTPLSLAATYGHVALIQLLLNQPQKPQLNSKDLFGQTAFGRAFFAGHLDCCKALLNAGADVSLVAFKQMLVPIETLLVGRSPAQPSIEQRQNIIKIIALLIKRITQQDPATFCQQELGLAPLLTKEILKEFLAKHP